MYLRHTLIVDGSYDHSSNITGIGIAVHEADRSGRNGILIDQIAESFMGMSDGFCELMAIYRALEIGQERSFMVLRIRSDLSNVQIFVVKRCSRACLSGDVGRYAVYV